MKSTRIIAIILLLIPILAFETLKAQDTSFRLSDYKNPNYFYQTLDLNFGLNSGLILNNSRTNDKNRMSDFSVYSSAGAVYSLFINSPGTQTELRTLLYGGISRSIAHHNYEELSSESNSKTFTNSENLGLEGIKRFYNAKKAYFEVNGSISCYHNGTSNNVTDKAADTVISQYTFNDKLYNLNISGAILIGIGRIEQVQDARMAMYLLEDLQKLNRQKQLASNEDILALAAEITKLKYKRFFDGRLRQIAEITALDSFLQKNSLAGTADATYFTSLTDNWNYSNNPIRNSGKRIFTGIEADYTYYYQSHSADNTVPNDDPTSEVMKRRETGAFFVAGATYEKPTSLKWQNSANLKIGFGFHQTKNHFDLDQIGIDPHTFYREIFPSMKLSGDYGFGYYPTSRTWVTFDWWILTGWEKDMEGTSKQDKEDFRNSFYTYTGPEFRAYYYLSEKLRLSLAFTGEFRYDNFKFTNDNLEGRPDKITSSRWSHQLDATLSYSLF